MSGARLCVVASVPGHALTRHVQVRMRQRALSLRVIRAVLAFGREVHVRGATIYAVGHKEVEQFGREGIDLSAAENVHVLCTDAGDVMTVYRNADFRGLRPRPRRRFGARAARSMR